MNRFRPFLSLLIIPAVVACGGQAEPAEETTFERTINVNVDTVTTTAFVNHVTLVGTVKAGRDIVVAAEVGGTVSRVALRPGARFAKGDVILTIDDRSLRQELEFAKAGASTAKEAYERARSLWTQDRIGSELAVLTAENQWRQAQANADLIQLRLEKATITAPFAGVLEVLNVEQGETVAPGTPLVRLIETGNLHIETGVPARYAGQIRVGDPVDIRIDLLGGKAYTGRVRAVATSVDPAARTFNVEVSLPSNDPALKVDLVAALTLETGRIANAIVVSQEHVQRDENGYRVFTVVDDNGTTRAKTTYVELGPASGNRVVITSGLKPGDLMVTRGSVFAENTIKLNIRPDAQ